MRITRIQVESFGSMRGRTFEPGPGLTVFSGPNESGKTTLMEFIRTAMAPSAERKLYPERRKVDSGSLEYEDGSGSGRIVVEGRSRSGDVPECLEGMDPAVFRSIFAMTASDLESDKLLLSDDIKSRFLSIPGGDAMPAAIDSLESDVARLIGKAPQSRSVLHEMREEAEALDERIAELRSRAESYPEKLEELKELEGRIDAASKAPAPCTATAFDELSSLRGRLAGLGDFERVSAEDRERHDSLSEAAARGDTAFRTVDAERSRRMEDVNGIEPDRAESLIPGVEAVLSERKRYEALSSGKGSRGSVRMAVPGFVLAIAGVAASLYDFRCITLSIAGIAVIVAALLKRTVRREDAEWMRGYESRVGSLAEGCGAGRGPVQSELDSLSSFLVGARALSGMRPAWESAHAEMFRSAGELAGFLSRFGGEDGYRRSSTLTDEAERIAAEIGSIERMVKASGFDPDSPCAEPEDVGTMYRRAGMLQESLRSVMDTEELDQCMDRRAEIESAVRKVLREAAVAHVASVIAGSACDEAYGESGGSVMAAADRYLSLMTEGRYGLRMEPDGKSLSAVSAEGAKGARQWSTGLRDQVLLSVKMAVAEEMGGCDVPMILDDVLLTFDGPRREGAMRALESASERMQILMFTCDDGIAGTAGHIKGCKRVEMGV